MPKKIETEYHYASIFSKLSYDFEIYFLKIPNRKYKSISDEYLEKYYFFVEDKILELDLLIFTGAALEEIDFEQVEYWNLLTSYFALIKHKRIPTINSCWSAMAGLYYYHGIQKHILKTKAFGIYLNKVINNDGVLNNISNQVSFPVSRFATMDEDQIKSNPNLKLVLSSDIVGAMLIRALNFPCYYIIGHPEYTAEILKNEYIRDLNIKKPGVRPPENYNLDNPVCSWRADGITFYNNIIQEFKLGH